MSYSDFYTTLSINVDRGIIDSINKFIDDTGHRTSLEKENINSRQWIVDNYGEGYFAQKGWKGVGINDTCHIKLPPAIFSNSDFEKMLFHLRLKYNVDPYLFKMPPEYYMNWHKDGLRQASFNYPLNSDLLLDSDTLFITQHVENQDAIRSVKITKVPYELGKITVINTQEFHCVFNTAKKNRFVGTLLFNSKGDNYHQVIEYVKSMQI